MAQFREPWNELGQKLTDDKFIIMLKTLYFSYNVIGFSEGQLVDISKSSNFNLDEVKIKCCVDRCTLQPLGQCSWTLI